MTSPTPPGIKPVVFPQPLSRGRRLWLLLFPLAAAVAVAGWWPFSTPSPVVTTQLLENGSAPVDEPASPPPVVADTERTTEPPPSERTPANVQIASAPPRSSTRANVGWLAVSSMPWGEVTVDERRVGPSPQTAIALTPGVHEVRIFRPGFRAFFAKVTIEPGRTARLTRIVLPDSSTR